MSDQSHIEWTNATWNPVTGCTKVSQGCKNCYAERFAERWRGIPGHPYEQGFDLKLWPERLNIPLHWKEPRMIFVNSMSDLFHEKVPLSHIQDVFQAMKEAHWHTFQILTKRSARLLELSDRLDWPDNVWMGVSVENMSVAGRVDDLRMVPAAIRFLSCEPLLGSLKELSLAGMQWVIVGGESGPGAREMKEEWVRELKGKCRSARIPFFFKQWGGVIKSRGGRHLDGKTFDEFPMVQVV
ncbi:MAG: phage Gp37/Gp68 family protein [Euryarchaeota archaeon]|nr:phage Gp37/Gp68 family protein [Euryarchaeota archaeon]